MKTLRRPKSSKRASANPLFEKASFESNDVPAPSVCANAAAGTIAVRRIESTARGLEDLK
jgi:hypothetical protein